MAGSGLPEAGSYLTEAGSDRLKAGSGLSEAGSDHLEAGLVGCFYMQKLFRLSCHIEVAWRKIFNDQNHCQLFKFHLSSIYSSRVI